jgi:SAM-dependent methyltransferase
MSETRFLDQGHLLAAQERERVLSRVLRQRGFASLGTARIFEAGSSDGHNLRQFVQWGARPENLAGIDLNADRVNYSLAHSPAIRVHHGNAASIPEPGGTFDITVAFSLFSRLRNEEAAEQVAAELFRITRPGGVVLLYEPRRAKPRQNRAIHAIDVDDVRRWFPRCPLRTRTLTLAPRIAGLAGRCAPWLYGPLAAVPLLRTHAIYILRRPATSPFDAPAIGIP